MDALRIPAVDRRRAASGEPRSIELGIDQTKLPPRIKSAFITLLESHEYARNLNADFWEFAVEISRFRSLNLANSDLRWLVARGLVDHAIEVSSDHDKSRAFRHHDRVMFGKRSCFVLTESGEALARELHDGGQSSTDRAGLQVVRHSACEAGDSRPLQAPHWDRHRRELRIATVLVKQFTIPDLDQESVLFAFDEQDWPARIDDPLTTDDESCCHQRLQATVHRLNRGQKQLRIRFQADDDGQGVRWEPFDPVEQMSDAAESPDPD